MTNRKMDLLNMPPEMISEIYNHLKPLDIVNFSKTSGYIHHYANAVILKQQSLMKKVIHDINLIQYKIINPNKSKRFTQMHECKYKHNIFDGYNYDVLDISSTKEIDSSRLRLDAPDNKYELSHTHSYFRNGLVTLFIVKRSQDEHYYDRYPTNYNFHTNFEFIAGPDSESDSDFDNDSD